MPRPNSDKNSCWLGLWLGLLPLLLVNPAEVSPTPVPEVFIGLDDSWSVYIFEAWGAPVSTSAGTVEKSPGEFEYVLVQHGDTLAIRDAEAEDAKTALVFWKDRPIKGEIRMHGLRKLDPRSTGAIDYINHLKRGLQKAVDEHGWIWPKEGIRLLDSLAGFQGPQDEKGRWTACLEQVIGASDSWNVLLKKVDDDGKVVGSEGRGLYSWYASRHGFFKAWTWQRLYHSSENERVAGQWLICYDLGNEKIVWSRRLKASGSKFGETTTNDGAYFLFRDGFIWVLGREGGAGYIELIEENTGASLAHRIVRIR